MHRNYLETCEKKCCYFWFHSEVKCLTRFFVCLVGTPSAFGPELAYRLRVAQPTLMDVPIFLIYFYITIYVCVYHIFMTSPLWLAVGPQSLLGGLFTNF